MIDQIFCNRGNIAESKSNNRNTILVTCYTQRGTRESGKTGFVMMDRTVKGHGCETILYSNVMDNTLQTPRDQKRRRYCRFLPM